MISRSIARLLPAAVLGMWPLAAGKGIGAEMRNDIGAASMGGILVSGIFTVIVIPILYGLVTRKSKKHGTDSHDGG